MQELLRESRDPDRIVAEAADFLNILQVALVRDDIPLMDVLREDVSRNNPNRYNQE